MKFYISNYCRIRDFKLTAIDFDYYYVRFYENGFRHNSKNACFVKNNRIKYFYLNGIYYGNQYTFTKKSWRHFIKLKAFL